MARPTPDMYSFTFEPARVAASPMPEHHLTPELRRLADLVLATPTRTER